MLRPGKNLWDRLFSRTIASVRVPYKYLQCIERNNKHTTPGLQFCVDGIPAFSANTLSLKPAEFVNLSLPPSLRGKAENILLLMLLPSSLKGDQSKKYYDFAAKYDLDDLFHKGKGLGLGFRVMTDMLHLLKP